VTVAVLVDECRGREAVRAGGEDWAAFVFYLASIAGETVAGLVSTQGYEEEGERRTKRLIPSELRQVPQALRRG